MNYGWFFIDYNCVVTNVYLLAILQQVSRRLIQSDNRAGTICSESLNLDQTVTSNKAHLLTSTSLLVSSLE